MKIYKKILKAFGGSALYLDKHILKALNIQSGDEVLIDVEDGKVTITKPVISIDDINKLVNKVRK